MGADWLCPGGLWADCEAIGAGWLWAGGLWAGCEGCGTAALSAGWEAVGKLGYPEPAPQDPAETREISTHFS